MTARLLTAAHRARDTARTVALAVVRALLVVLHQLWVGRTLVCLVAGGACVAAGAGQVYPPARLIVAGGLLLVVAWPTSPKGSS